jgi:hypothetical protein
MCDDREFHGAAAPSRPGPEARLSSEAPRFLVSLSVSYLAC